MGGTDRPFSEAAHELRRALAGLAAAVELLAGSLDRLDGDQARTLARQVRRRALTVRALVAALAPAGAAPRTWPREPT